MTTILIVAGFVVSCGFGFMFGTAIAYLKGVHVVMEEMSKARETLSKSVDALLLEDNKETSE